MTQDEWQSYLCTLTSSPLVIKDPNTGVEIWESSAIIAYLITEYDKSHMISYASGPEKYLQDQWFFFQASGQGPYYGQAGWYASLFFLLLVFLEPLRV